MAFTKLAARIDAGVVIEMRAMPPDEPEVEGEKDESGGQVILSAIEEYQKKKSLIDELNARGRLMYDLTTSEEGQRLIVEKPNITDADSKIESADRTAKAEPS